MTTKIIMREKFAFSAAHYLPTFPEGHKCRRLHGHTWDVIVDVAVDRDQGSRGYAFDHAVLRTTAGRVIGRLDHRLLNEIEPALERGLAEDVLSWIVDALSDSIGEEIAQLVRVELVEHSSADGHHVEHSKVWTRAE